MARPRWTVNCNLPTQHQSEIILCNTDIKHRSQPGARPLPALIREMAFGPLMDEVRVRGSQDIGNYWGRRGIKQWVRGAAAPECFTVYLLKVSLVVGERVADWLICRSLLFKQMICLVLGKNDYSKNIFANVVKYLSSNSRYKRISLIKNKWNYYAYSSNCFHRFWNQSPERKIT